MNKLVSIVVPVYNVEKYLDRCVTSLVNQSYSNIEIILVDDGSKDLSGDICDKWANHDHRIKVIHQKNAGLSMARNAGVKLCTGSFLTFVDSDDWLHHQMISCSIRFFADPSVDVVEVQHKKTNSFQEIEKYITSPEFSSFDKYTAIKMNYAWTCCYSMACCKLFRMELVRDLEFPAGKQHEDEYYTYKVLFRSQKIIHIHDSLYYYYVRPDSIMGQRWNLKKFDGVDAYLERIHFFEKLKEVDLVRIGQAHFVKYTISFLNALCNPKWMTRKERETLFLHYVSILSKLDMEAFFQCLSSDEKEHFNAKAELKRLNLIKFSHKLYMYDYYRSFHTKEIREQCKAFGRFKRELFG